MRHSIDRIIRACDESIAQAEKAEAVRVKKATDEQALRRTKVLDKRRDAAKTFTEMAASLKRGQPITEKQKTFLKDFYYYRGGRGQTTIDDLADDLDKKIEPRPAPADAYIYQLRAMLRNLKSDNDGTTTVSTSFLKDAGFGSSVIQWITRLQP